MCITAFDRDRRRFLGLVSSTITTAACAWETPIGPTTNDLFDLIVVTITEPGSGAIVDSPDIIVRGTFSAQRFDEDIWLIVWPSEAGGTGYPQSRNARAGEPALVDRVNRRWSVGAGLGGPPQTYEISVHIGDTEASRFLREYFIDAVDKDFFAGLSPSQLPRTLIERHRITIRRR